MTVSVEVGAIVNTLHTIFNSSPGLESLPKALESFGKIQEMICKDMLNEMKNFNANSLVLVNDIKEVGQKLNQVTTSCNEINKNLMQAIPSEMQQRFNKALSA